MDSRAGHTRHEPLVTPHASRHPGRLRRSGTFFCAEQCQNGTRARSAIAALYGVCVVRLYRYDRATWAKAGVRWVTGMVGLAHACEHLASDYLREAQLACGLDEPYFAVRAYCDQGVVNGLDMPAREALQWVVQW